MKNLLKSNTNSYLDLSETRLLGAVQTGETTGRHVVWAKENFEHILKHNLLISGTNISKFHTTAIEYVVIVLISLI